MNIYEFIGDKMREENNKNALEVSFAVREHRLITDDINELIDQLRVFAYINPTLILRLRCVKDAITVTLVDKLRGHQFAHCIPTDFLGDASDKYIDYVLGRFRCTLLQNEYKI